MVANILSYLMLKESVQYDGATVTLLRQCFFYQSLQVPHVHFRFSMGSLGITLTNVRIVMLMSRFCGTMSWVINAKSSRFARDVVAKRGTRLTIAIVSCTTPRIKCPSMGRTPWVWDDLSFSLISLINKCFLFSQCSPGFVQLPIAPIFPMESQDALFVQWGYEVLETTIYLLNSWVLCLININKGVLMHSKTFSTRHRRDSCFSSVLLFALSSIWRLYEDEKMDQRPLL